MSRDFVGALLQLNAEKQVPREQLVRTVEEAIQAAYRRVSGGEDIHVRIDAETGKQRVFRARYVVGEIEGHVLADREWIDLWTPGESARHGSGCCLT